MTTNRPCCCSAAKAAEACKMLCIIDSKQKSINHKMSTSPKTAHRRSKEGGNGERRKMWQINRQDKGHFECLII